MPRKQAKKGDFQISIPDLNKETIEDQRSKTKTEIDWSTVRRILVVRLRSIGDTVLSTPSLIALRRFLPDAQIDILLEDWVSPVLEGFEAVDNIIVVKKDALKSRLQTALKIRRNHYDVAYNLHGGSTSTFFIRASGAKYRVGYENYRYKFLYNLAQPSSAIFWQRNKVHSAEQQLALLGFTGVPVLDQPKTHLAIMETARLSIENKLQSTIQNPKSKIALLHPTTAFETKQWATENFAQLAEFLSKKGLSIVAVGAPNESKVLENLKRISSVPVHTFADLSLPEISALAARAEIFIGNDSGIAHMAAAVNTPTVAIFGSSNIHHWRPWTDAPNEIVYQPFACQPCPGYVCKEFGEPRCILSVTPEQVFEAVEKVLTK